MDKVSFYGRVERVSSNALPLVIGIVRSGAAVCIVSFCLFGIMLSTLIPPFQVPDEPMHWIAGYARTHSTVSPSDPKQHCSIANALPALFEVGRIAFYPSNKFDTTSFESLSKAKAGCSETYLNYGVATTYPGILLGRLFTLGEETVPEKTFQVFLLGRLFQGALIAFLFWRLFSVALATRGYMVGMLATSVLMLSPLFIQQSFAISADGVTFALSLSLLFFLFFMKEARWLDWLLMVVLATTVSATKPPLFLPIPVFLGVGLSRMHKEGLLHEDRGPRQSWRKWLVYGCIVMSFLATVWVITTQSQGHSDAVIKANQNRAEQVAYVKQHPMSVAGTVISHTEKYFRLAPLIGPLGWLDASLSAWTVTKYRHIVIATVLIEILLVFCLIPSRGIRVPTQSRVVLTILLVGSELCAALAITFILYLTWTPAGAATVMGVQGRYFLPMLLTIPLVLGDLVWPVRQGDTVRLSSGMGSIFGTFLFSFLLLSLAFPLYLDLIRRWW